MGKQNTPTNAQLIESLIERLDKIFMVNGKSTLTVGNKSSGHFIHMSPKRKQPSEKQGSNSNPSEDNNNNQ